ncbi:FAD-dependent oxidoreductase [Rhodoplanes elegans]|uniref:FAD-dependent oxidoreductase n=1 Tax=Rhodoplanes elegans TaxID=29408 RepID=A0A327K9E5_9BRAD|nr:NAD(P)/FAD-dependent oxidoreductase [Rhodoplanes elegans]MBK5960962.1 FAD-dependent oxidoreductase [Rhodoplanes elegans]RAI35379.1 FAD-dependent oxidoreductase [Rhodoplanes elegans]
MTARPTPSRPTASRSTTDRADATHTDVFVVGAGPAGLTAAYMLSKHTPSVIVIEKDPVHVGGISRTVAHDGFLFDIGGHRFFSKSKEVVDLWNEILPDDFIERPRLSRIFYGGKFYSYPLNATEALRNLGIVESAACVMSYLAARLSPIEGPRTFHDWVRNQFGERLFSIFFKTYTEKVWGMSCDDISADWAAQRIKGLDLKVAVINALKRSMGFHKRKPAAPGAPVVKTLIETFRYPRKGPGMMWEAAARKIEERGAQVLMGRDLVSLVYDEKRQLWDIEVATADGPERYTAWHVISSAPLAELVEKIRPRPISTFHGRSLRYRDFLTVALMVDKPDLFPDNWIYIHDPSVKVGRVQNFRSWSPEMVPTGKTCLGLEYFCFEGDGVWTAPDEELIALATREVEQIGLVTAADVTGGCVVRQPKAYPVYDDAYRDNVAAIRRDLELGCPNLHLVGRNGMHKYNNQDHAMMTAMLTAENILSGERRFDVWNVNEDAEYHEAGSEGSRDGRRAALSSERAVPKKASDAA